MNQPFTNNKQYLSIHHDSVMKLQKCNYLNLTSSLNVQCRAPMRAEDYWRARGVDDYQMCKHRWQILAIWSYSMYPPAQWNTIWPPCTCRHEYQLVLLFVSITEWKMAILLVLSAFSAFSSLVSYDTITHLNTTLNNNELASFVWLSIY